MIQPQIREREVMPGGDVKIAPPKSLPSPPNKPGILRILISSLSPLVIGVVIYMNGQEFTNQGLTYLAFGLVSILTCGGQLWQYQASKKKYERECAEREKQYRRELDEHLYQLEEAAERQRRVLWQDHPAVSELLQRLDQKRALLWNRFPSDNDFLVLRVGTGERPFTIKLDLPVLDQGDPLHRDIKRLQSRFTYLPDLPISINLNKLSTLGIQAPLADSAIESVNALLVNIITHHSPEFVQLYLFSHRADASVRWQWLRWLPHTAVIHTTVTGEGHLSFTPDTDDDVLIPLTRIMRQRIEDRQQLFARYDGQEPHLVVIFDETPYLHRHQLVHMLLAQNPGRDSHTLASSGIFIGAVPAQVNALLRLKGSQFEYRETWRADGNQTVISGETESLAGARVAQLARKMAPLHVASGAARAEERLPKNVRLVELLGATQPQEVDFKYLYGDGYDPRRIMSFPIGLNEDLKPQKVILREDAQQGFGHHALLAGATGKGKSVTLQSIVLSLAANNSPQFLNIILADFKGGASELAPLRHLPHVVGFVTDLDESLVERFRLALAGEVRRRKMLFEATPQTLGRQIQNIYAYNQGVSKNHLPHLLLVIDEFAKALQINPELKVTLDKDIAAQGRALGIHMLLSTQKAADFTAVRPNVEVRMSMQVTSAEDSRTIFNRDDAYRRLKHAGQAFLQVGDNRIFEMFQVARTDIPYTPERSQNLNLVDDFKIHRLLANGQRELLYKHQAGNGEVADPALNQSEAEVLVTAVKTFCQTRFPTPDMIFLPPLPPAARLPVVPLLEENAIYQPWLPAEDQTVVISPEYRLQVPIGMMDLPAQQEQLPFSINLTQQDGNFLLIGAAGTGQGLFFRTLILALALTHPPDSLRFYFVSKGTVLTPFEQLPHLQTFIQLNESERIMRLLKFLQAEIDRRLTLLRTARLDSMDSYRSANTDQWLPAIVILIEDVTSFLTDYPVYLTELEEIMSSCATVDLHIILGATSMRGVHPRVQQQVHNRIVLGARQVTDTVEAFNKRSKPLPDIPGRGYLFHNQEIAECQVASPQLDVGKDETRSADMAQLQHLIQKMSEAWQEPSYLQPLPTIQSLPKVIRLQNLWKSHIISERGYEQATAAMGLNYESLAPVYLDYNLLEPYNLITGPPKSGKTSMLMLICLATATALSPDHAEILIFGFKPNHPLSSLQRLPHVQFAGNPNKAMHLLTELERNLQERADSYQELMENTVSSVEDLQKITPKRSILLIDDLKFFSDRQSLNELVDRCMIKGNELGIRLFLADTGNNISLAKQNFSIKYIQNACRHGSGVAFSTDSNDLSHLGLTAKLKPATLNLHKPFIGNGRGFLSYQGQTQVVQFASVGEPRATWGERLDTLSQLLEDIKTNIE
ncbi:MAG: hypothetical protein KC421_08860 [Anaerolineales bacterium]|nr:hypothetical protein [Anaerolineales bacterium]